LPLHFVSGERHSQSFRQTKSEPIENRSLHGISTIYAAQARLTSRRGGGGQHDVVALDGGLGLELGERISTGRSGFDIRTFECPACDHVHQRVVAPVDPMKSRETATWFRGELRAPT
jgi:hypothetical protein